MRDIVPPGIPILDVSRPERSSPAEGSHAAHLAEQARIVEAAFRLPRIAMSSSSRPRRARAGAGSTP